MMNRDLIIKAALAATLVCAATVFAQAPVVNIGNKHPDLRSAQEHIVQAYQIIDKAQQANKDQLAGHAQKAKDLLVKADEELRLAANTSNADGR
jgi:hypothetical protein